MRRARKVDPPHVLLHLLAQMRCTMRRCGQRLRPPIRDSVLCGIYPFDEGTEEHRLFDELYDQILCGKIRSRFELYRLDRTFDALSTRKCLDLLLL
jgi:hypothetical protein